MTGKLKRVLHFMRNAKCYFLIGEDETPACGGINCIVCGKHDHRSGPAVRCIRCEVKLLTQTASLGNKRTS